MRAFGAIIWLLKIVVMVFVLLGLGQATVVEIWESINMEIKTIVQSIWVKLWPQKKKSVMSHKRYRELSTNLKLKLTQKEINEGWFFCCEWDGMLINKDEPEASCCGCLPEEERPDPPEFSDPEDFEF